MEQFCLSSGIGVDEWIPEGGKWGEEGGYWDWWWWYEFQTPKIFNHYVAYPSWGNF